MKIRGVLAVIVISLLVISCTTSSMSRKEIEKLASGMTYVTIPASVFKTAEPVRVHYVEMGDPATPPIILIHGFSSSTLTWNKVMPELAKSYHVFALDMPGWGFSDKPKDFPYGEDAYVTTVLNFMDQKGLEKATIGGNSMGGGISLWVTINHPERVTNLILIDALGYSTKGPALVNMASKSWLRPIIKPFFGKFFLKTGLKQVYYDDSKVTPQLIEEYGRAYKTPNAKDVPFWLLRNFGTENRGKSSEKIATVKTPTLIIWGENDPWIPLAHAHLFNKDIQGSVLVVIPKCGHVPEEECPEVVSKAILDFLKKI